MKFYKQCIEIARGSTTQKAKGSTTQGKQILVFVLSKGIISYYLPNSHQLSNLGKITDFVMREQCLFVRLLFCFLFGLCVWGTFPISYIANCSSHAIFS